MRQLKQRPSPRQINALLSLYKVYESTFPNESPVDDRPSAGGASSSPLNCRSGAGERESFQLALPIFDIQRERRLAWASGVLGRDISSFTELHPAEAAQLIDIMKRALGQKVNPPSRRRPDRDQAQAYGTAGRRGQQSNEIQLVDDATLDLVADLVATLGWSVERFDAFLNSRTSPVSSGTIRTLAEANRVIWALKNMLRRQAGNFYRKG